jgi:hypothetical protein
MKHMTSVYCSWPARFFAPVPAHVQAPHRHTQSITHISLRDTGALPRANLFAESQISGARQRIICRESALGKDWLSAKPRFAESSTLGKDWLSAKPNFAESSTLVNKNPRQSLNPTNGPLTPSSLPRAYC